MPSMQLNDVTAERLARLAAFEPGADRVLSLYFNLDPTADFATHNARESLLTSVLDEAERRIEGERVPHDVHMALREDVRRAREDLEANLRDDYAEGAHGLAVFVCGPRDLYEVVRLPRPVENRVVIADRPAIETLAEVGPARRWLVLLVDGRVARVLEGAGDRIEESQAIEDEARGKTSQGGWSAARYERAVDKEARDHLLHTVEVLGEHLRRHEYEFLLVGTTPEHFAQLEDMLPADMREKVAGRFDVDASVAQPQEVRELVAPLLDERERAEERKALDALATRGAQGLEDVLPALYERRVETLLIEPELNAGGAVCARCHWMAPEPGACPVDGTAMEPVDNVVEAAVASAVEQDAEVLAVRWHDDLQRGDGIAAVLRF